MRIPEFNVIYGKYLLQIDLYRLIENTPSIFHSGTARFFEITTLLGWAGAPIPHPRPFAVAAAAAIYVPASVALSRAAGYHPVYAALA